MIRVGPCGWAYKDWDGIVYPTRRTKEFDRLTFLSAYFDAIEIDTSFYGSPRPLSARKWSQSVEANPKFRFTAKLLQAFTHQRNATPKDEREFKDGMAPLMEAGRFGALLLQFPWSFKNTPENRGYVATLHRTFAEYPCVLEVRHASWAVPDVLDFLAEIDIGLCNIDQPLFHRSIKPGDDVTSSVGYVRLHGRNFRTWFAERATVSERYHYLYSLEELEPWVDRIKAISQKTKDTYAMSNNHHVGQAIRNSLDVVQLLNGKLPPIPPEWANLPKQR
jgi:uncharacterized protein YecE (DUF72 family)